jgi:hypothetical protein
VGDGLLAGIALPAKDLGGAMKSMGINGDSALRSQEIIEWE